MALARGSGPKLQAASDKLQAPSSKLDKKELKDYKGFMRKIRSKHNNLLNYFLYDDKYLSKAYIKKCKKFFKEIERKNENKRST